MSILVSLRSDYALIDNGRTEGLYAEFQTALDDALPPQSKMALAKRRRSAGNTDRVDAEMRAGFGLLLSPRLLRSDTASLCETKELHAAHLALMNDRTTAKNRGGNITRALLQGQNVARLKQVEAPLDQIERAIIDHITSNENLNARFDILVSIPRLSGITAFTLLIEIPELAERDEKAVGKLSGFAPLQSRSQSKVRRAQEAGNASSPHHAGHGIGATSPVSSSVRGPR